jgi:hypothetical protein
MRVKPDALEANFKVVDFLKGLAARKGTTPPSEDLREIDTEASEIKVQGARGTGQEKYA